MNIFRLEIVDWAIWKKSHLDVNVCMQLALQEPQRLYARVKASSEVENHEVIVKSKLSVM